MTNDYSRHGDIEDYIAKHHRDLHGYKNYRSCWAGDDSALPRFVLIETQSSCNLRCEMCIQSIGYPQVKPLSDADFEIIATQIEELEVPSVALNYTNEPLLDRKIVQRIRRISEIPTVYDIHMNTNGAHLSGDTAHALLDSGLTRLLIGFDGYSKSVYETVRARASYDTVLKNTLDFLSMKETEGAIFPVVRISFVRTKQNEHEIEDWHKFWSNRADYITIQEYVSPVLDDSRDYIHPDSSLRATILPENITCRQPSERVTIRGDGSVLPCCSHFATELVMGNLNDEPLEEIWNKEQFVNLRNSLLEPHGYTKNPICKRCIEVTYQLPKQVTLTIRP